MPKQSYDSGYRNKANRLTYKVHPPRFPNADEIVRMALHEDARPAEAVDIMLVNPPAPDGGIWIRSQHRVGRRSRENMLWPQVSLAQMAALLAPTYKVKIVDAIAERMNWPAFVNLIDKHKPKYYLTQVTAPTLENDMYGVFLAKERGITTIAFGTHVTPIPRETMQSYPSLDFIMLGEPDLTIRDLLDHLENKWDERPDAIRHLFAEQNPEQEQHFPNSRDRMFEQIQGLVWRHGDEISINAPRPFIRSLDDLPLPLHHMLPLDKYRMPMIKGPFTFVVPSRGCPAGCTFCIKHVTYQYSVRFRSPENLMKELWQIKKLGINNVHMYADLFTVSREQVMELCESMIAQKIHLTWTCNSRVDYVDEELLSAMASAGCHLISWGIESANEQILRRARKGTNPEAVVNALKWAKAVGIKNWGYFIIGLPGETEDTIKETILFAKRLPLDIALFHIAAPHPGTPFFFEVVKNGWFRSGTRWEQVDMDKETVLDYPELPGERLEYWQKRAFLEWALRPPPLWTFVKILLSDLSTLRSAVNTALQHISWAAGHSSNHSHTHTSSR